MPKRKNMVRTFSTPSGRFTRWADVVRQARRQPNVWGLALWNVPLSRERSVNERRHPDLRFAGGHLQAEARNIYTDDDGRKMADVFVRFIPEGDTP